MSEPVAVRYKPWFGIVSVCAGLFVGGTGLLLHGRALLLLNGGILLLVGLLQLTRPLVVLHEREIEVRNLLGMTMRRIDFAPADVTFEGLKVFVRGERVRAITPWALDTAPLEAWKSAVLAAQAADAFD